jgi:hypothetical protein
MTSRIFIARRTLTVRFPPVTPTPTQLAWRGRIEAVLRVVGPGLDLLLAAGDRLSRIVETGDRVAALPLPPQRHVGAGTAPISKDA